jgi:hypothetical protein
MWSLARVVVFCVRAMFSLIATEVRLRFFFFFSTSSEYCLDLMPALVAPAQSTYVEGAIVKSRQAVFVRGD